MRLKSIELAGFKSFAKKSQLEFGSSVTSIVGPNGSGKSNIAESFRFVLGEQSMKSMRGKRGEDLIWNGSQAVPRAGRASVKLIFDNSDRALNLDFDEVTIERAVHRDGVNEYSLNGSQVRLRDISELLAQANIGASGHHIISQGEADHVLTSSSRERREMIEDALGLTAYLYKREEAEKKLGKTAENMREVEALRRELVPHLKFLASQVKKIEESQVLRDQLAEKYAEYLKRESVYLELADAQLTEELEAPTAERRELDSRIDSLRGELASKGKKDESTHELIELERVGRDARNKRESATRELGRLEGEIAAAERIATHVAASVSVGEATDFAQRIESDLEGLLTLDGHALRERLGHIISFAKEFIRTLTQGQKTEVDTKALQMRRADIEQELHALREVEEKVVSEVESLRRTIDNEKDANREAERELFSAMAKRSEVDAKLTGLHSKKEMLQREQESFKTEFTEAGVLLGRAALQYESYEVRGDSGELLSPADIVDEERGRQEERRRKVERMKIRLEEIGSGNHDEILKEHKETTERDQFLMRELEDLAASSTKLHQLIDELTQTLETRFMGGIEKINNEFDRFFKLMFGGGTAGLMVVKESKPIRKSSLLDDEDSDEKLQEDEETEEGIEINIALPHKRVKGLHMLSGGERALTSIALIFAMSQVNPPPFLILDETDAALDEANSRRYGDMIENLSRKSQLIVITHNRETMSRAGILYGITMGSDGASKLLSVKFEDALAVAK